MPIGPLDILHTIVHLDFLHVHRPSDPLLAHVPFDLVCTFVFRHHASHLQLGF